MTNITDVFFDLDHTLWDFDKNSALTFQKIFKLNGLEINLSDFLKVYEPLNLEYWRLYRNNLIDKESLRYKRLKDTFNALEVEVSDALINTLSEDYIRYLSTFNHLFPDTIAVLEYLKSKYTLHIITNGFNEVQHKKMKTSKIASYFKTITDSERAGVKKPNPIIFNYAMQQANATPDCSLMIGDSLEADIKGALDFGMQAIWFNYKNSESDFKGVTITNLKGLLSLL